MKYIAIQPCEQKSETLLCARTMITSKIIEYIERNVPGLTGPEGKYARARVRRGFLTITFPEKIMADTEVILKCQRHMRPDGRCEYRVIISPSGEHPDRADALEMDAVATFLQAAKFIGACTKAEDLAPA